ncbi:MAG: hypothetical protein OEZ06_11245 [Myxococcales bacterium]|nr:hypothetical protein [Myxococcales bacterium]
MHDIKGKVGALVVLWLAACGGDAAETAPPAQHSSGGEARSDAEAQQAARAHPIAQPEPRPALPDRAPPPRPERPELPEKAPPPRPERGLPEQAPAARLEPAEAPVYAPRRPPAPQYEMRPPAPAPYYVWAPGYWYWYGSRFVWIDGLWMPPRQGYVYVGARWTLYGGYWNFRPGGWAVSIGSPVLYPVYHHHHLFPGTRRHHYHPRRSYRPRGGGHVSPRLFDRRRVNPRPSVGRSLGGGKRIRAIPRRSR